MTKEKTYVIFSDIHGNHENLVAVLEDARQKLGKTPDEYWFLGDLTLDLDDNERACLETLDSLDNLVSVLGNHEFYRSETKVELRGNQVSYEEISKILSPTERKTREVFTYNVLLIHGSPTTEYPASSEFYIFASDDIRKKTGRIRSIGDVAIRENKRPASDMFIPAEYVQEHLRSEGVTVCFIGHTHRSFMIGSHNYTDTTYEFSPEEQTTPLIVSPGAIYDSRRVSNKPTYAIFRCSPDKFKVELHTIK